MLVVRSRSHVQPWSRAGEVSPTELLGPRCEHVGDKWEMNARHVKEQISNLCPLHVYMKTLFWGLGSWGLGSQYWNRMETTWAPWSP